MAVILIGGGSRSGKTRFALERARSCGPRLAYIATAELLDDEMRARAAAHRTERGPGFETIEEPFDLAAAVGRAAGCDAVIVDCLTLWLSNLMLNDRNIEAAADALTTALGRTSSAVILVTNEVGCGIVPENELARRFRDKAGWLNQHCARLAGEVYWMVFGHPLRVR